MPYSMTQGYEQYGYVSVCDDDTVESWSSASDAANEYYQLKEITMAISFKRMASEICPKAAWRQYPSVTREFDGKHIIEVMKAKPKKSYQGVLEDVRIEGGTVDEAGIIHCNSQGPWLRERSVHSSDQGQ